VSDDDELVAVVCVEERGVSDACWLSTTSVTVLACVRSNDPSSLCGITIAFTDVLPKDVLVNTTSRLPFAGRAKGEARDPHWISVVLVPTMPNEEGQSSSMLAPLAFCVIHEIVVVAPERTVVDAATDSTVASGTAAFGLILNDALLPCVASYVPDTIDGIRRRLIVVGNIGSVLVALRVSEPDAARSFVKAGTPQLRFSPLGPYTEAFGPQSMTRFVPGIETPVQFSVSEPPFAIVVVEIEKSVIGSAIVSTVRGIEIEPELNTVPL